MVIWPTPLPLNCPRGLWMTPKDGCKPCFSSPQQSTWSSHKNLDLKRWVTYLQISQDKLCNLDTNTDLSVWKFMKSILPETLLDFLLICTHFPLIKPKTSNHNIKCHKIESAKRTVFNLVYHVMESDEFNFSDIVHVKVCRSLFALQRSKS